MDGLRQYLISVTAAAIICSICKYFAYEKSASGTVISLIAGLIMAITVISPIVTLERGELPALSEGFITEAKDNKFICIFAPRWRGEPPPPPDL